MKFMDLMIEFFGADAQKRFHKRFLYNFKSVQHCQFTARSSFTYFIWVFKLLRPNEIQLVNRRIGKTITDSSQSPNSILDLRRFFMLSSEKMNESQLNYLLVKKRVGHEYKKNRQNILILVGGFLPLSLYWKDKQMGKIDQVFKASFPAETTTLNVKKIEKVIEITYINKGIIWDSKQKKSKFSEDVVDEFVMHYHQARVMFTNEVPEPSKEPIKPLHQSSIPLQGKYNGLWCETGSR